MEINMNYPAYDEKGYLETHAESSALLIVASKALRSLDFHANGRGMFKDDFIFGRCGSDRTHYIQLHGDYSDYTILTLFLVYKGYIKILIDEDKGVRKYSLFYNEIDLKTFKNHLKSINGSRFRAWQKKNARECLVIVKSIYKSNLLGTEEVKFLTSLKDEELFVKESEHIKIYAVDGPDIIL